MNGKKRRIEQFSENGGVMMSPEDQMLRMMVEIGQCLHRMEKNLDHLNRRVARLESKVEEIGKKETYQSSYIS